MTNARRKEVYKERRARGICPRCGVTKTKKSRCGACSKKAMKNQAVRRAKRKANGLCTQCSNTAKEGHTQCAMCLEGLSARSIELMNKRRIDGTCLKCGAETGKNTLCPKCHEKNLARHRARYYKLISQGRCGHCGVEMEGEPYTACANCQEQGVRGRALLRSL